MSKADQPKYEVLESYDNIELRQYEPMIVAEVEVLGERKDAIRNGFRILADYIFGNNNSSQKGAKNCCPKNSETIAMTAPVTQQESGSDWKVRFSMPNHYTIETLPRPNNHLVKIIAIPTKRYAVIRFRGRATDENIQRRANELQTFISQMRWLPLGAPILAFYNPPWTLPFFRRNEIMVEIE